MVGADDVYTNAVFASLAGWEAEVVGVPRAPAGETSDETLGRSLAWAHGADAVSWVRERGGASELVVYDVDSSRVIVRTLDRSPPFDEVTAAAVALTIKTVLRTTRIAPVAERTAPPAATLAPASPRTDSTDLEALVEADGSAARSAEGALEARGGLGLALWPSRRWGFAMRLAAGTGAPVQTVGLDATLLDLSGGLAVRARLPLEPFAIEVGAGASLHAIRLTGRLLAQNADVSVPRVDPSLDGAIAFEWAPASSRVRAGLRGGLGALLRSQRYLIGGVETLSLMPLMLEAGLRVGVRID